MKRIKDILGLVFNAVSAVIMLPAFLFVGVILGGLWLLSGKETKLTCFGQEPWPSEDELKSSYKYLGKSIESDVEKSQEKKNTNITRVPLNHRQFRRFPAHSLYEWRSFTHIINPHPSKKTDINDIRTLIYLQYNQRFIIKEECRDRHSFVVFYLQILNSHFQFIKSETYTFVII